MASKNCRSVIRSRLKQQARFRAKEKTMGRGLAAFLAGAGSGYMDQRDVMRKQKIEDNEIAYRDEQRARLRTTQGR